MQTARKIGDIGEALACAYLEEKGYTILCRNYIAPHGEIDIVAQYGQRTVFCEVKTRTVSIHLKKYGRPAKAVNARKWEHLFSAARSYLNAHPEAQKPRLDVIEVYLERTHKQAEKICHYESAYAV